MFIRDVFFTLSTQIISIGGNFLIGILLARTLTVTERGIMVMVMTLPWLIVSLAGLGLPQANIYLVGRRKHVPETVWGNALVNAAVISLLVVLLLNSFRELILATMLKGLPSEYWWRLMLLVPALLVDAMTLSMLRARQRFDLFNLRRLVTPPVTFVGFAIALLALRGGLSTLIDVYVTVTVVLACLGLILTCREMSLRPRWSWRLTREALGFGLKSYLQNLMGTLNYRLDVYLLAYLLAPRQVAFYGVASSLAEVAWHIPNSVGTVLFPRLSHAPLDQVDQVTAKVCRNTLALAGCTVLGLLSAGWILVPTLYGSAYRATIPPLVILLPGVLSMSVYKVLTRNYSSRGRQQVSILASGLALVLNVGLNWWLIPLRGVIGAATASTTGYTVAGSVLLILFLRDSGLSWQECLLPRWNELIGHLGWAKENLEKWKGRRGELWH